MTLPAPSTDPAEPDEWGADLNAAITAMVGDAVADAAATWTGTTDRFTVADWEATRGPAPYYIAHRGSGDIYPEHSLAGYDGAYAAGAQAMEISVVQSADGTLYCQHDLAWDRTVSTTGNVSDTASPSISGLTLLPLGLGPAWASNPERPALFEDVIRRYGGRTVLICEAKRDAAYPAMVAMIERYGLADSTIIKAFYTSGRLAQAKAAGYKTFGYFGVEGDITGPNIATLVAAAPDYFVIPTYGATHRDRISDANVDACVATGLPVWVYHTHRRADVARMVARGVVGVVAASFPYLARSTPILTRDAWALGAIVPGELTVDPPGAVASVWPQWVAPNIMRLARPTGKHFMLLGQLCPLANAAGTYHLDVDFRWPTLPADLTQNITVALGRSTDDYYEHQLGRGTGYHAAIRANGSVQLFTHVDGSTSGTQIGTTGVVMTAPPVAGTWYHARIDVTPAGVTFTVNDGTDHVVTSSDTTRRGGYVHIGKSSTDGVAEFRSFVVS